MKELEKILEEISVDEAYLTDWYINSVDYSEPLWTEDHISELYSDFVLIPKEIIHKYAESNKDSNVLSDDGWIPVEKELPPFGKRLQATILHHEWVSDYDTSWAPEEQKIFHPAYTEVCEIYPIGGMWFYNCAEDDYEGDVVYINPLKDISCPVAEIIAWRPLPETYRPEKEESKANQI